VAALAVVPLIAWLMRDDPRDVGLRPLGETGPVEAQVSATGNPAKRAVDVLLEAVRVRDFWLLAGATRTSFGSYAPAFIGAGALCVIAALIVLPIGKRKVLTPATVAA
ncbi:MAG TPA: hypothetical protein VK477_01330, partial [Acidobacteriota bacterium]|nr:hypothetical protein [Acidobacteriota bacterium]